MMSIISKIKSIILFCIVLLMIIIVPASAEIDYGLDRTTEAIGKDQIVKKTSDDTTISSLVGNMIGYVLSFIGTIFMIAIIYGGFLWMTAKGNESQVDKAKTIMRNSIIGFVVVALAYVISTTVLNALFDIAGVTE